MRRELKFMGVKMPVATLRRVDGLAVAAGSTRTDIVIRLIDDALDTYVARSLARPEPQDEAKRELETVPR